VTEIDYLQRSAEDTINTLA